MRSGYTLLELVLVLAILAILLAAAGPRARAIQDRIAVRAARETVVGLFVRARAEALIRGGAEIAAWEDPSRMQLIFPHGTDESLDLGGRFAVRLEIGGPAADAIVRFDGLGIGRVASRTFRFQRGQSAANLTVSSFGRVRRW